ncbi:MAG TPA: FecR domain-containing protein, partial [Terriglobales bacterium]|nr:FecR domain-containing protein [Terriglobales bacterium]
MSGENRKPDADLDKAISALRNDQPAAEDIHAASERLWAHMNSNQNAAVEQIRGCADIEALLPAYAAGNLSSPRVLLVENHLRECVDCRDRARAVPKQPAAWNAPITPATSRWGFRQFAMAASILLVIGLSAIFIDQWFFAAPAGMRAKVQSVDGALYRVSDNGEGVVRPGDELAEGEIVRTAADSHAFVQLHDGSVVEMNERAEFSVTARRRDTTVHLDQGRIIVQAAKRRNGHLYVLTPDARVAVTGTVFSVNSGMKGSRVAVIEGEVHVAHAGINDVLHAGDQVATSASMNAVPVRDEIAWSRNLDKHLALLAQFAKLQHKFEQIQTPGLRYSSSILARVPANTMVFASMPNLGQALSEANRIFQDQLQQSPVLREWWNRGKHQNDGITFEQLVEKVHVLSQYLGDEVALVAVAGQGGEADAVVIAEVRRQGLQEFLQSEFSQLGAQ